VKVVDDRNAHCPDASGANPHCFGENAGSKWTQAELKKADDLLSGGRDGNRIYVASKVESEATKTGEPTFDAHGRLQVEDNGLFHYDCHCIHPDRVDNHAVARAVLPDIFDVPVRMKDGNKHDWNGAHKDLEKAMNGKMAVHGNRYWDIRMLYPLVIAQRTA